MFLFLNVILFLVLIVFAIIINSKIIVAKNKKAKVLKGAVAVLAVVIFLSCMYFRFTNIFIMYESPIQAYDDENFGRYSAIAVLEGEKTAFVGDIEGHNAIYIRTNNGISDRWKLTRYDKMKIQNKYIDGIFLPFSTMTVQMIII